MALSVVFNLIYYALSSLYNILNNGLNLYYSSLDLLKLNIASTLNSSALSLTKALSAMLSVSAEKKISIINLKDSTIKKLKVIGSLNNSLIFNYNYSILKKLNFKLIYLSLTRS